MGKCVCLLLLLGVVFAQNVFEQRFQESLTLEQKRALEAQHAMANGKEWPWYERDSRGNTEPFRGYSPPFKPVWIAMPQCCLIERQMNQKVHLMESTCTQYKVWKCIPEGWACEEPMPVDNPKMIAFPIGISRDIYEGEVHGTDVCFAGCPRCAAPKPQDIRPLSKEGKKKYALEQAKLAKARKEAAAKAAAARAAKKAAQAKAKPATPVQPVKAGPVQPAAKPLPPTSSGCTRTVVAGKVVETCKTAATIYPKPPQSASKPGDKKPVKIEPEFACKRWKLAKGKVVKKCQLAATILPVHQVNAAADMVNPK